MYAPSVRARRIPEFCAMDKEISDWPALICCEIGIPDLLPSRYSGATSALTHREEAFSLVCHCKYYLDENLGSSCRLLDLTSPDDQDFLVQHELCPRKANFPCTLQLRPLVISRVACLTLCDETLLRASLCRVSQGSG